MAPALQLRQGGRVLWFYPEPELLCTGVLPVGPASLWGMSCWCAQLSVRRHMLWQMQGQYFVCWGSCGGWQHALASLKSGLVMTTWHDTVQFSKQICRCWW